ncbi:MAG TPA: hypothetical protein VMU69_16350 [Bradyrhizobium sp.]|nr:hypothetical protein [Bradyrhizobium sp.]
MATRSFLVVAFVFAAVCYAAHANAQGRFQCDAFRKLPNGELRIVKGITVTTPDGNSFRIAPDISLSSPGVKFQGVDLYALYAQNCH